MNQEHEIVLYQIDETNVCVNVIFKDETFWLSQKAMAELFDCSTDNISLHLRNIYSEEELEENSTAEYFSVVQKEGTREVNRNIKCYNLDAIIAYCGELELEPHALLQFICYGYISGTLSIYKGIKNI